VDQTEGFCRQLKLSALFTHSIVTGTREKRSSTFHSEDMIIFAKKAQMGVAITDGHGSPDSVVVLHCRMKIAGKKRQPRHVRSLNARLGLHGGGN